MFDLSGRNAFVTGSARGIGLAIAQALAGAGAKVLMHGATASGHLAAAASALNADYVVGDLCKPEDVDAMAAEAQAKTVADIPLTDGTVLHRTRISPSLNSSVDAANGGVVSAHLIFAPLGERDSTIIPEQHQPAQAAERLAVYSATKAALPT